MTKRIVSLFLVVSLSLIPLAGCQEPKPEATENPATETPSAEAPVAEKPVDEYVDQAFLQDFAKGLYAR
jgi:hypothetical protein